jgi:hypothetical protein
MASGQTLSKSNALGFTLPSSNFPNIAYRNAHPILQFDAATEEAAYFNDVLPRNYGGGGLTLSIYWMATSATTGVVKWGGSIERHQASTDDLDADSFATEQTNTGTAPGTSGQVLVTTITFSSGANMDNLAAGESFRLKIARKAADAADTMTGDAEILRIEIKET